MKYFKTYQYLVYILITATEILYLLNWFWVSLLRGTFIEYSVLLSGRSAKLFARLNCKFGQCVLGPKLNSARKQTTTRIREALFIWYTIGLETLQRFAGAENNVRGFWSWVSSWLGREKQRLALLLWLLSVCDCEWENSAVRSDDVNMVATVSLSHATLTLTHTCLHV